LHLRQIIEKAVEQYNRFRSPEAIAKFVTFSANRFIVEFNGPFCQSCGICDYFEDLIYELKEWSSTEVKIVEVKEINGRFNVVYEFLTS